ncbi:carboxymuconolactone decarboxylase family protein [Streptomyces sp. NPDC002577]
MARVPYLRREDADESLKPLYDRLETERKVPTANIFLALTHAPAQLDAFLTYANSLRAADLSPRLRELAILTVGHATRSAYEVAHHQSHGLKAGLTEEQLAAVANFEASDLFDETEKAVMRLAEESTLQVHVSEETWRAAAERLSERQLVELSLSIAWYNSGVRIMGLLDIDLEDNYPNPFPSSLPNS